MPTNGGRDGDGGATNAEKARVYELLGFTQVTSSANPSPVRPFGTTTLSWEAKLPTNLHSEVTIVVAGNEVHGISPGTLSGSATVTLDQTTIFGLTAPAYIERGSPWENGYIESFNARLRDELLNGEIFYTLREAQIVIESWRRHYNTIRPHASIGYKPPAPEVFVPAFAAWPAALRRPAPPATLVQRPTLN